jgi:nitrate reductase NapE component
LLVLAAFLALPRASHAQGAPGPAPTRGLTAEQLDAFVQLVGDPKPLVWQRLLADPGLVPYAAAAADARLERRASGKTMTIVGFSILGVGVIGGYALFMVGYFQMFSCLDSESCHPGSFMLGGLAVMAGGTALGLSLGIPGIIRITRPSEAENAANDRYQNPGLPRLPPYPASYQQSLHLRPPARTLSVPILSFTF